MLRGAELDQPAALESAEKDTGGAAASATAQQSRSWKALMAGLVNMVKFRIGAFKRFL
jgi:hypothetical protein